MANPAHLKILKQGVEAWNRWRRANDAGRPDLSGSDLPGVLLKGADLQGVNFRRAQLVGATLVRARLSGSDLSGADLRGANLRLANLIGADLSDCNLVRTLLLGSDLEGATLRGAYLGGALLRTANLQRANFVDARLGSASIDNVDLSSTAGLSQVKHYAPSSVGTDTLKLSGGEIPEAFLRGCGLSEWEMMTAKLYNPNLSDREITAITYDMDKLRGSGQALQFYSAFISYSHADRAIARRLHDQLQSRGIRCWLDEHNLKPGDRILDAVNDAIRLHDRILLCCSEASLTSWWVKDEIRKALERERAEGRDIIIPLMVDRYLLDGWEDGLAADLRSRLAADFTGWEHNNAKFEEQFERVVRALRADEGEQDAAPESQV